VDDDPDIQTTLELRMREYAVEVEHAYYGMQGVVAAVKTRPDLILMDLAMPNGDGEYLLECLKKNDATFDIPMLVLTGMRNPELKHRLLNAGAKAFLSKPVHFDELFHEMSRFIDIQKHDKK
jgi:DNA-binding response OmpR family regulator